MLSSAINRSGADDSTMPGDYQSFPGPRSGSLPSVPQPVIPTTRTPFPSITPSRSTVGLPAPATQSSLTRPNMTSLSRPIRTTRRRRRSLTPDIVIESRSHHRSSNRKCRVIRVPLDSRPTLGLRGPPNRVVEIERIPCHRRRRRRHHHHRKSRSVCYDIQYEDQLPSLPTGTAQLPMPIINPTTGPLIVPIQSGINPSSNSIITAAMAAPAPVSASAALTSLLSNLSQEMIDNLPRNTVHLPPLHLPGSQANENTGLHTVVFPAEVINPVDGTLSIIQSNSATNNVNPTQIQPTMAAAIQPVVGASVQSRIAGAIQPTFAAAIRPTITSQIQPNLTGTVQPQLISVPRAIGMPTTITRPPVAPQLNNSPLMQRFQEIFQRLRIPQTEPISSTLNPPVVQPALTNISQFDPRGNTANSAPIASVVPVTNTTPYPSANIRPVNPTNVTPYRPANITPYRPSTFTPSTLANNQIYRPSSIAQSIVSDIGPYAPANITAYSNVPNRLNNNPYTMTSGISSSVPSGPSVLDIAHNYMNPQSLAPTLNQISNSVPKSILRNGPLAGTTNTTYNSVASPNFPLYNDTVPKTTRFS